MKLRVLVDKKHQRRGSPSIAISNRLSRLTLNRLGYEMMTKNYGNEVTHMQVLLDDDEPGIFYVKPVEPGAEGAKKLVRPSPGTRSLQISMLLRELQWDKEETVRYPITWDSQVMGGKVDVRE